MLSVFPQKISPVRQVLPRCLSPTAYKNGGLVLLAPQNTLYSHQRLSPFKLASEINSVPAANAARGLQSCVGTDTAAYKGKARNTSNARSYVQGARCWVLGKYDLEGE